MRERDYEKKTWCWCCTEEVVCIFPLNNSPSFEITSTVSILVLWTFHLLLYMSVEKQKEKNTKKKSLSHKLKLYKVLVQARARLKKWSSIIICWKYLCFNRREKKTDIVALVYLYLYFFKANTLRIFVSIIPFLHLFYFFFFFFFVSKEFIFPLLIIHKGKNFMHAGVD